jgi:putative flippase GtrA
MKRVISYGAIGLAAAGLDFTLFMALRKYLALSLITSNTIAVCSGIVFSFFMNRHFSFQTYDRIASRFVKFLVVAICGLALSNASIFILSAAGLPDFFAKSISIAIVGACQFGVNYLWTFSPA